MINNITKDRYAISNFIKFTDENSFNDYDFFNSDVISRTLRNLPSEGIIVIQSNAPIRLDKISFNLYGTTSLWWLLAIYNDIHNVFCKGKDHIKYPSIQSIETWYFTNREKIKQ